jgi:diaminopimelate decarboxylase
MSSGRWDDVFENVLRSVVPTLPPGTIDPATDLHAAGLDSMASVQLLVELESIYDISIPDDSLEWALFATPSSLWSAVQKHRSADM